MNVNYAFWFDHIFRHRYEICLSTRINHIDLIFLLFVCTVLTHWGRVAHLCVGNLTVIGSDNGLSPGRRQAIIWTNAGLLLIGPLGTNFSEILIEILTFSFRKMRLKVSSAKWRPFCLGLNVLTRSVLNLCDEKHISWYIHDDNDTHMTQYSVTSEFILLTTFKL